MASKDLTILVSVPFDLYFASEIEVQATNFRKWGVLNKVHYLIYEQGENVYKHYWDKLEQKFPEAKFFFYNGDEIKNLTVIYPPVIRPNCLKKHFKLYPELEQHVLLYMDGDVLFTSTPDLEQYINDDICYLSPTDYISPTYFTSKRKDVFHFKLEEYDRHDILKELCNIVGIDKQTVIDNEPYTGGCQYILKNINAEFWEELERVCIELRMHCLQLNAAFFPSEEKGLQSWAIGDMCGLLWLLWKRGLCTRTPDSMKFSWSSSPIELYDKHLFFHNAGVASKEMVLTGKKHRLFHKSDLRFRTSTLTFFDIKNWGEISTDFCSYKYVDAIKEVNDPVCVTEKYTY